MSSHTWTLKALVERGWAADAEARPSAEEMAAAVKEEMEEMRVLEAVVGRGDAVEERNPVVVVAAEDAPVLLV